MATTSLDAEKVFSKLSLDDKIRLCSGADFWRTYSDASRGLPYAKLTDGPNGARGGGDFTNSTPAALFPSPSCLGATFDVELARRMGQGIARDSRSKACHVSLAPTINIQRDPRAGRFFESYSEDPVLSGELGSAWVSGCQSVGVGATPKHFVGNEAETDRMRSSSDVDEGALREVYLEPFKRIFRNLAREHAAALKEGKGKENAVGGQPACIMTAYNRLNGWSCSENEMLQVDILRKEWGFKGLVMSDWFALHAHGLRATNLEMPGPSIHRRLDVVKQLLEDGSVTTQDIDRNAEAVLDLLTKVAPLGFSASPEAEHEKSVDDAEINRSIRQIAAEGAVLVKNENSLLPLDLTKVKKIALIGKPWTNAIQSGGGSANLTPQKITQPLECLRDTLREGGHTEVQLKHHFGTEIHRVPPDPSSEALLGQRIKLDFLQKGKSVTLSEVHAPSLNRSAPLPGEETGEKVEFDSVKAQYQLKAKEAGVYRLGLLAFGSLKIRIERKDGKHMEDFDYQGERSFFDYVLNPARVWEPRQFEMKQDEIVTVQVEYQRGEFTMPGATPQDLYAARAFGFRVGFERQIDADAALDEASELASQCDMAIVMTATGKDFESEGFDREHLRLPRRQDDLITAIAKAQKNTVVLNQTGSVVEMPWIDEVKGLIQAWFGGQETGWAICDVLLGQGRAPASGRFAQTWARELKDHPSGEKAEKFPGTHRPNDKEGPHVTYAEGRLVGYKWYDRKSVIPRFWFGGGLGGYTTFKAAFVKGQTALKMLKAKSAVPIKVSVRNTGARSGKYILQVYIKRHLSDETTKSDDEPSQKLAAFRAVHLNKDESTEITLQIEKEDVSSWNATQKKWRVEQGQYGLLLAESADPKAVIEEITLQVDDSWVWEGIGDV